jgi:hypothetical protein
VGAALVALLSLSACSTVTIRDKSEAKMSSEPSYESSESFFLWGLVGEKHIDVQKICGKQTVRQAQSQFTLEDSLLTLITLGIYQPRTVKIWCEEGAKS